MKNLKSLDSFINEQYGERGSENREKFERGFEKFKQEVSQPVVPLSVKHSRFSSLRKVAAL
jgi:hypothetical protein